MICWTPELPGGPPIRAWPRSSHAKWCEMTVLAVALGICLKRFKVGLSHICEVLYIFDHHKYGHENISQMNAHPVFRHHIFRVHSFQMSSTHGMWLRLWLMCDRMCFNIFNSNGSTCQSNAGMIVSSWGMHFWPICRHDQTRLAGSNLDFWDISQLRWNRASLMLKPLDVRLALSTWWGAPSIEAENISADRQKHLVRLKSSACQWRWNKMASHHHKLPHTSFPTVCNPRITLTSFPL
jgi:hypothetical protein